MSSASSSGGQVADWTAVVMQETYGIWLLGIVSLGLIAYGLYSGIVLARYRRIQVG